MPPMYFLIPIKEFLIGSVFMKLKSDLVFKGLSILANTNLISLILALIYTLFRIGNPELEKSNRATLAISIS